MSVGQADRLITIEVPPDALTSIAETPQAFAKEMQVAAAIEWYREGRLSQDKAAEIAGLSRADFASALGATLPPFDPRPSPMSPDSAVEGGLASEAELAEVHYRRLGCLKGPDAAPEAQRESRWFWESAGVAGIRWLIARLRDEPIDERLRAVASLLADMGPVSLRPILDALEGQPTANQAWSLLRALGWLGDRQNTSDSRAELVLVRYLFDDDPELRETSARALRLLPRQRATDWLSRRLRDEPDREVKTSIEDELEALRGAEVKPCLS